MRILHVSTVSTGNSGIPNVIFNLFTNFQDDSIEIGYVSINDPPDYFKNQLEKIHAKLYIIPRIISKPCQYIYALTKVARNYDIMHVHGNSATMVLEMLAGKLAKVKIRIAHSHSTTCKYRAIDYLARPLFYSLCNGRLACSNGAGRWLFGHRSFEVIKNGILCDKFHFSLLKRVQIRQKLNIGKDEIVIGHIGNFVEAKNHKYLIKSFEIFHNYKPLSKLLLLGDGVLMNDIIDMVKRSSVIDNIIMVGNVNNPEDYMNAMDIIAMPSLYEGFPLTLLEEQANGLPIIASDIITKDTNISGNIVFRSISDDINFFKDCTKYCTNSEDMREGESKRSSDLIKYNGYDIKIVSKQLMDYYRKRLY